MSSKQTWIIISHPYNMDGRAASHTITDKIPYLLQAGIEPVVLSGITGDKDKVVEHHQLWPYFPVALRFDLRHYLKKRIASRVGYRLLMLLASLLLLPFFIIEKLFVRIETHWSWAISAYLAAARIIKTRQPTLVYTTGGPYCAHLAGYWLSRRFGITWIAEIHDPMIFPGLSKSKARLRFSAWMEGKICDHADVVWWFTEEARARAKARHPKLGDRGHSIIPGADAPDFARTPYIRGKQLVIGHFGSLADTRNLGIFMQGLQRFIDTHPQAIPDVRLHLYGGVVDSISAQAISHFSHPEMIEQFGRLETDPVTGESGRDRVLKRMNAVDCLLLLHGTIPFCEEYIPSKLYEYLWTQRPVLALVWRNPQLEQMLHELGCWAVKADDVEATAAAIHELYVRWQQDALQDSGSPSPYTTEASVRQILQIVNQHLQQHGQTTGKSA